jgi:hypothetical protein
VRRFSHSYCVGGFTSFVTQRKSKKKFNPAPFFYFFNFSEQRNALFHTKKEKISALRTLFKNKFTLYGYFLVVVVGVVNAGAERVLLSPAVGAQADVFLVLALSLPAGTTSVARADTAASAAALAATLFAAAAVAGA